jgi:hypothetical protein
MFVLLCVLSLQMLLIWTLAVAVLDGNVVGCLVPAAVCAGAAWDKGPRWVQDGGGTRKDQQILKQYVGC